LDATVELEMLGREDWEEPFDETECEDSAYEQDAALVSDLFRQLTTVEPPLAPTEPMTQLEVARNETGNPDDSAKLAPALLSLPGTKACKSWIQSAKGTSGMVCLALGMVVVTVIALGIWWCQGLFPKAFNIPASESRMQVKTGHHPKH
ncbi:MAG: hypothetical protein JO235_19870, partial [Chroococcidiopsidaceae cyanobacterium CP_BM_RX_35]|nr:hypothetical protein [Chroococcidiopsidaceae cyanobacterium CP_BM_RX_35]